MCLEADKGELKPEKAEQQGHWVELRKEGLRRQLGIRI